jgi:hypothetical protein
MGWGWGIKNENGPLQPQNILAIYISLDIYGLS